MADTRVNITAGSGTPIDGFTQSDGDIRQAMVLGDAAGAQTTAVDSSGRLSAMVSGANLTTPAATALASGASYTVSCGQAGNISFWLQGSNSATLAAVTIGTIVFEQSDDGNSWSPLPVVRSDTNTVITSISAVTVASGAAIVFDAALEGVNLCRARATTAASSGSQYVHALLGGMPFSPGVAVAGPLPAGTNSIGAVTVGAALPTGGNTIGNVNVIPGSLTKGTQGTSGLTVQNLRDAGRVPIGLIVDNAAVGTANAEALQSYGGNNGASALAAGTGAFVVPTGKIFRITSVHISATGSAAGLIRIRLRYAATIATSSPLAAGGVLVIPAASSGDSETMSYPDGIEISAGNAIGISYFASATTLSFSVFVTGFTY